MTAKPVQVCPACRGVARSRPLPPEGFWQVQVLQRIGMYPYRCEACGVRFFRRVRVSQDLGKPKWPRAAGHATQRQAGAFLYPADKGGPKVITPPEMTDDGLTHADFVDLIDHISRSEERKGLKKAAEDNADE